VRSESDARGTLCVTIAAPSVSEAMLSAARARELGAGMVEYRLDALREERAEIRRLFGESPLPAIATFRRPEDGGTRPCEEGPRLALLREALRAGASWIDIEFGRERELAECARGRLVVSHHDLAGTPTDLAAIARRIESGPADVVKLATLARSWRDALAHLKVLRAARKPTVAFAMGELGACSRVLCLAFGSPWTYVAPDDARPAAPGQIGLERMVGEFKAARIRADGRFYGVIGHPIAHSMSPAMHNAALEAAGLPGVYVAFDVESDPASFVREAFALGAAGLSVTIPHKVDVMAALDEIEPGARRIGAVNTVWSRGGRLCGTNTDIVGAARAIAQAAGGVSGLEGKSALVLGAGGASRAICFGLADAGVRVAVTDVIFEKAVELARASGAEPVPPGEADPSRFDIVANATPVGMHPNVEACPIDASRLRAGQIVFDAVYNPRETLLLREARRRGCVAVEGVDMFVEQGAEQFELWTGGPAPRAAMREAVLARLGR